MRTTGLSMIFVVIVYGMHRWKSFECFRESFVLLLIHVAFLFSFRNAGTGADSLPSLLEYLEALNVW